MFVWFIKDNQETVKELVLVNQDLSVFSNE